MTFEQLKTFVTVTDAGSFTLAANSLYLSQPAVSQNIQALERSLNRKLFDRRGRSLVLTLAGERLLSYARAALRERDAALADLEALDGPLQGVVTVGAINSVGIYSMPERISRFQALHPSVRVGLKVGNTEGIIDELLRGELDLAVIDAVIPASRAKQLQRIPYRIEELVLVVPPGHPWSDRVDVAIPELYEASWVMRSRFSRSRAVLEESLVEAGADPSKLRGALELDSTEAIKQAVCAGLGLGFLPDCSIQRELTWGVIGKAHLEGQQLLRQLYLYAPAREGLAERVQALRAFLEATTT